MSRSRVNRSDYGEKWAVAVTLLDEPLDQKGVEEHFEVIGRRFGVFDIESILEDKANHSFSRWIENTLNHMVEIGWVEKHGEMLELTYEGRKQAEKAYSESQKASETLKKALAPSMVSTVTFVTHLVLAIIKLPAALLSGSVGLLSDSLDTLVDAISSLVVWIGIRRHKEEVANTILVILMIITGGYTLYKAVERIFNPVMPEVDAFTFVATIVSAFLCLLLFLYQRYTGVKTKTPALITQSVDSRNHVIAALSVVAGLVAVLLRFVWLDIAVGLVVSGLICKSAVELLIDLIKRAGGEEVNSFGGFSLYANYKSREYRMWILNTINENEFASQDELVAYVKERLDTRGNRTLMALDKDVFTDMDSTVIECIEGLKEDGSIDISGKIKLTDKGIDNLSSTTSKPGINNMKYLKALGFVLWYVVEFMVLYFGARYLSNLIGLNMLWQNRVHTFNVLGRSVEVGNLVATGLGMFMYVFGRYHFTRVSKSHRHMDKTTLLTTGYYEKSRHPMYGMMVTMQVGILSALCFRWAAIISIIWFGAMYFNAYNEERSLIKTHGASYQSYMSKAKNRLFVKAQMVLVLVVLLNNLAGIFGVY